MLQVPPAVKFSPSWAPLAEVLEGTFATSAELASRWRISVEHLSNLRSTGRGPAFTKLYSGSVRYPISEIIGAELHGASYHVTQERLSLALATMPGLDPALRARIEQHLVLSLYREKQ